MSLVGHQESVNNRMMMPHICLVLKEIPLNLFTLPSCPVDNNKELKQSRQQARGQRLVNEFIIYLRISLLSSSVQCAYWAQNSLKLDM